MMCMYLCMRMCMYYCVWTSEDSLESCSSPSHFYMDSGDPNTQGIRCVASVLSQNHLFKKLSFILLCVWMCTLQYACVS